MRKQQREFIPRKQASALLAYTNEYQTLAMGRPNFSQLNTPKKDSLRETATSFGGLS